MKHVPLTILIALSLPCLHGAAAADEFLNSFAGSWKGTGWARATPDTPREVLRCRVSNRFSQASTTLYMNGRCASPGKNTNLKAELQAGREAGYYSGYLNSPSGSGRAELYGRRRGDGVSLQFRVRNSKTKQTIAGTFILRRAGKSFSLSTTGKVVETGKSGTLTSIRFTR